MDATIIAGINAQNPQACTSLLQMGCTTSLNDVSQLDAIPAEYKIDLTIADLCPCGACSEKCNRNFNYLYFNTNFINSESKFTKI